MHVKGLCGLGTAGVLSHLDVSMNDPSAVQVRQPLEHLLHDGSYLYFSQALQVYLNDLMACSRAKCPHIIDHRGSLQQMDVMRSVCQPKSLCMYMACMEPGGDHRCSHLLVASLQEAFKGATFH